MKMLKTHSYMYVESYLLKMTKIPTPQLLSNGLITIYQVGRASVCHVQRVIGALGLGSFILKLISVYDDDDGRRRRTQSERNSPLVLRTKWAKKTYNFIAE